MSEQLRGAEAGLEEERLLTTGEMARLSGTTLRTVRFYEEAGVLSPERRSAGGHRLYHQRALERLVFIHDLRVAGASLDEIRELLETKWTAQNGREAAQRIVAALDAQIVSLSEKVERLNTLRAGLLATQRGLQGACQTCSDAERFPDDCDNCDVMKSANHVPLPLRVLWGVRAPRDEA